MKKFILIIFILVLLSIELFAQKHNLGVNIDNANAFVNLANHLNNYSKAKSYDSLGWPQSDFELLFDGRPVAEWSNDIDDPSKFRTNYSGIYKCSFKGSANVVASWSVVSVENKIYDPLSNTTYFDLNIGGYPNTGHGLVNFSFTSTKRSPNDTLNSGITNLKINRPSYPINSTKIFTDEYISLLKSADFSCYRFYGVQNIWDGEPTYPKKSKWNNRKTPNDASQSSMKNMNNKSDAWSWDYIIALANILKKDIWVNVYISADSDYVINLANLLKTKLDPSINIYVENSNEVWSPTQTTHGPYNKSQADEYKITFDQNYARRTVEVSNLFKTVFGIYEMNKRVRVVLGAQQAYGGRSDTHLDYINKNIGSPSIYIYALAPSLYFGSKNSNGDTNAINQGMLDDIDSQLQSLTDRKGHLNRSIKWSLVGGCVSYEGGPSIPASGGKTNLSNQILANRTYKMKEIIKKNFQDGWFDIGGNLAMYFTLYSGYNRYGCWGLTDDYNNSDRNFKMQAVREIIGTKSDVYENKGTENIFSVAPNPFSSRTTLIYYYSKVENNLNIRIINEFGIIVENKSNLSCCEGINKYTLDMSKFPNGVYCVEINDGINSSFLKMIKSGE